jgi:hypothetical protein
LEKLNISVLERAVRSMAKSKQNGQKGKPGNDAINTKNVMAAEEMEKATHPTGRQNSEQ